MELALRAPRRLGFPLVRAQGIFSAPAGAQQLGALFHRPLLHGYAEAVKESAYYRKHSTYGLDAFDNGAPVPYWARNLYGALAFKGRHRKTGPSAAKPLFADSLAKVDANPFATAGDESLWAWFFRNRYDMIVDDASDDGWLPNAALLLLEEFGVAVDHFKTAKGARTWFYHYGSLLAAHVVDEADAKRPQLRDAVRRLVTNAGRRRNRPRRSLLGSS